MTRKSAWLTPKGTSADTPQPEAQPEELIQPTPGEAKNGWTAETLTAYVRQARKAEADIIEQQWRRFKSRPRPTHGGIAWAWQPRRGCR